MHKNIPYLGYYFFNSKIVANYNNFEANKITNVINFDYIQNRMVLFNIQLYMLNESRKGMPSSGLVLI